MGSRTGATRAEVLSTIVVVALLVLGIVALWPRTAEPGTRLPRGRRRRPPRTTDLAPLRAAPASTPAPRRAEHRRPARWPG